mmetsp:Transcript_84150/g.238760  ORF Transcript_84150/g.238760 Transcript_84150/m.238760 type:complete len:261 (+) Transcript_84150:3-785(+)
MACDASSTSVHRRRRRSSSRCSRASTSSGLVSFLSSSTASRGATRAWSRDCSASSRRWTAEARRSATSAPSCPSETCAACRRLLRSASVSRTSGTASRRPARKIPYCRMASAEDCHSCCTLPGGPGARRAARSAPRSSSAREPATVRLLRRSSYCASPLTSRAASSTHRRQSGKWRAWAKISGSCLAEPRPPGSAAPWRNASHASPPGPPAAPCAPPAAPAAFLLSSRGSRAPAAAMASSNARVLRKTARKESRLLSGHS